MHEYKFSIFKRPCLGNFYFDIADSFGIIHISVYQTSDNVVPKCKVISSMFENNDLTKFVEANAKLKVKGFRFAFGILDIDCY